MKNSLANYIYEQKAFEHRQFQEWLISIFKLKERLQLKYDQINQDYFYIKIYEFITTGKDYLIMFNETIEQSHSEASPTSQVLLKLIDEIINSFNEPELEFIEFRRHSASHIFTEGYNIIKDNMKLKKERGKKNMLDIHSSFDSIFEKHATREGFDLYFNTKVFTCLDKYTITQQ